MVMGVGWEGKHTVQRDPGDECMCINCRHGFAHVHQEAVNIEDCTCGARRTLQHYPGCPCRDRMACPKIDEATEAVREINHRTFAKISAERKAAPLYAGCIAYFPDALLAVARLSKKANDKHNPGEPLHWSKEKSNDHADCLLRHQLNPEEIDPEVDEIHAVMVAWRALAQLQTIIEKQRA